MFVRNPAFELTVANRRRLSGGIVKCLGINHICIWLRVNVQFVQTKLNFFWHKKVHKCLFKLFDAIDQIVGYIVKRYTTATSVRFSWSSDCKMRLLFPLEAYWCEMSAQALLEHVLFIIYLINDSIMPLISYSLNKTRQKQWSSVYLARNNAGSMPCA